jgi:hypothetical protein
MITIQKMRSRLMKRLSLCKKMVKGSVNSVCTSCARSKCICANTKKSISYRLTYKDGDQKTKIVYVPKRRLKEIRAMLSCFSKCRSIVDQLIDVSIKEFKMKSKN